MILGFFFRVLVWYPPGALPLSCHHFTSPLRRRRTTKHGKNVKNAWLLLQARCPLWPHPSSLGYWKSRFWPRRERSTASGRVIFLQAVISMETQTAVLKLCRFYFTSNLRVAWSVCSMFWPPVVCSRAPGPHRSGFKTHCTLFFIQEFVPFLSLYSFLSKLLWLGLFVFYNHDTDDISK